MDKVARAIDRSGVPLFQGKYGLSGRSQARYGAPLTWAFLTSDVQVQPGDASQLYRQEDEDLGGIREEVDAVQLPRTLTQLDAVVYNIGGQGVAVCELHLFTVYGQWDVLLMVLDVEPPDGLPAEAF
ncbi:hypothetical protein MTO96_041582 [Rhipicephalus appendiculatus]